MVSAVTYEISLLLALVSSADIILSKNIFRDLLINFRKNKEFHCFSSFKAARDSIALGRVVWYKVRASSEVGKVNP